MRDLKWSLEGLGKQEHNAYNILFFYGFHLSRVGREISNQSFENLRRNFVYKKLSLDL